MTGSPKIEIGSDHSQSNSKSKDADVSSPKEVNLVCSGDIQSAHEEIQLIEGIHTKGDINNTRNYEDNGDGPSMGAENIHEVKNYENKKFGPRMKTKDKNNTKTLVVFAEKLELGKGDREGSCCLDPRVLEEDVKGKNDLPTSEAHSKVVDEEQCSLNVRNFELKKSKSKVAAVGEASDMDPREGMSSGLLKEIIVDNPRLNPHLPTLEKISHTKNQNLSAKKRRVELVTRIKEDKAKQPIAVMVTTRPKTKRRGKPKSNARLVTLKGRKSSHSRSTSVAAEKTRPQKPIRRKSTGSCNIGPRKTSNCSHIIEHNLYIKSHSNEFRKRIKNVKSRLFKETKSFVAYKSARHREAQERRNRVEEIARKTKYLYADRSIDFSKKSKRQREDIWRRRSSNRK